jgi:2-C-methyl-D-erythritol 4-phosphate cytidylyltransferase
MTVVALVPVTGRTGQFGDIASFSLLEPVLRNLDASGCIDLVFLVTASSDVDMHGDAPILVVGIEQSAFATTNSLISNVLPTISVSRSELSAVLVHDPRHAFAPPELVGRVVAEVRAGAPAVVPVLPCTDTVKELDESGVIIATPDRSTLRVVQSPVGFAATLWREQHPMSWRDLPPGARTIPGHPAARAIRTAFDLAFAKDSSAKDGS